MSSFENIGFESTVTKSPLQACDTLFSVVFLACIRCVPFAQWHNVKGVKKASRKAKRYNNVVDFEEIRARLRLLAYQTKVANVLANNREAINRLHSSGAMFSFHGAKAARDLLLAQQHLLRVVTLLNRLSSRGAAPNARMESHVDAVFLELDALLARSNRITHRTGTYLTRLKSDS